MLLRENVTSPLPLTIPLFSVSSKVFGGEEGMGRACRFHIGRRKYPSAWRRSAPALSFRAMAVP